MELFSIKGALLPKAILILVVGYAIVHVFRVYWRLRHIPGPFWARFTNIQRVSWVWTSRAHEIHQSLHETYGEVVRLGPNMVSLTNPAWIPMIYPSRMGVLKAGTHWLYRY